MNKGLSRLQELVELVLPKVSEENFSLQTWQNVDSKGIFTCCACGWAAHHVPFISEGLTLQEAGEWSYSKYKFVYRTKQDFYSGFTAVCMFFSLNLKDANYLFVTSSYPLGSQTTKAEVIERITDYIRENLNG